MAKEYIEREAAINAAILAHNIIVNNPCQNIRECVGSIPAADVVSVVRCGECKHCVEHYDTDGNAPYWVCKEWDSGTDYDGYCHYGEKKGDGT